MSWQTVFNCSSNLQLKTQMNFEHMLREEGYYFVKSKVKENKTRLKTD